jgi:hypothetical protein
MSKGWFKVFKAKSEGVRSVGKPRKRWKSRCNRMLPAFCAVATGSWPLMIEHCGGRRQRRPRPDLGCSAIGWMVFWDVAPYSLVETNRRSDHSSWWWRQWACSWQRTDREIIFPLMLIFWIVTPQSIKFSKLTQSFHHLIYQPLIFPWCRSGGIVLTIEPKVRRFKPDRGRWSFKCDKNP